MEIGAAVRAFSSVTVMCDLEEVPAVILINNVTPPDLETKQAVDEELKQSIAHLPTRLASRMDVTMAAAMETSVSHKSSAKSAKPKSEKPAPAPTAAKNLCTAPALKQQLSTYEFKIDNDEVKIENDLEKLLSCCGSVHYDTSDIICPGSEEFLPATLDNVCYIMNVVVFDENKVLLIQESKESCRGKWYIPATKVEPNENFKQALQRGFESTTGLTLEPGTLLAVESQGPLWYRFTFNGSVSGGTLKTTEDNFSMSAEWFDVDELMFENIDIRSKDMLPLLVIGNEDRRKAAIDKLLPTVTVVRAHQKMKIRFIMCFIDGNQNINVLKSKENEHHLPIVQIDPRETSVPNVAKTLYTRVYGNSIAIAPIRIGVLAVEYGGGPAAQNNGLCLSLVYMLTLQEGMKQIRDPFTWHKIADVALNYKLLMCLKNRKIAPLLK